MIFSNPHLFQTKAWDEFQKEQGKTTHHRAGEGWHYFAIEEFAEGTRDLIRRLYIPYGPVYSSDKSLNLALEDIGRLASDLKVDYIRIEPFRIGAQQDLAFENYHKMEKSYQPSYTNIVDLLQSHEAILARMTATNRRTWKTASENGHSFEIITSLDDMSDFLEMMKATAKRTGTVFRDDAYLTTLMTTFIRLNQAGIAYVSYQGKRLGGSLFIDDPQGKTRYYMYTGTFDEAREHRVNSTLVTYMMFHAKDNGMHAFDFFGVAPADASSSHPWYGFSVFKRAYGGEDVSFSGTWELPCNRITYSTMKLARKLLKKR